MTKVNSNGDTENHVHNFDYKSVIGRSDGPMIDLENCDRFRTLLYMMKAIHSQKEILVYFQYIYHSSLGITLTSVIWTFDDFQNNTGINYKIFEVLVVCVGF